MTRLNVGAGGVVTEGGPEFGQASPEGGPGPRRASHDGVVGGPTGAHGVLFKTKNPAHRPTTGMSIPRMYSGTVMQGCAGDFCCRWRRCYRRCLEMMLGVLGGYVGPARAGVETGKFWTTAVAEELVVLCTRPP